MCNSACVGVRNHLSRADIPLPPKVPGIQLGLSSLHCKPFYPLSCLGSLTNVYFNKTVMITWGSRNYFSHLCPRVFPSHVASMTSLQTEVLTGTDPTSHSGTISSDAARPYKFVYLGTRHLASLNASCPWSFYFILLARSHSSSAGSSGSWGASSRIPPNVHQC